VHPATKEYPFHKLFRFTANYQPGFKLADGALIDWNSRILSFIFLTVLNASFY
jgi:hypothetical protein